MWPLRLFLLPDEGAAAWRGLGGRQVQGQGTRDTWSQEQVVDQSSKICLPTVPGEGAVRGPGWACAGKCQAQIKSRSCFVPSGFSVRQVPGSFSPSPHHSWVGGQGSTTSPPRSASPCAQSLLGDLWRHSWCCPRVATLGRDDGSCTQCGQAPTQPVVLRALRALSAAPAAPVWDGDTCSVTESQKC